MKTMNHAAAANSYDADPRTSADASGADNDCQQQTTSLLEQVLEQDGKNHMVGAVSDYMNPHTNSLEDPYHMDMMHNFYNGQG